MAASLHNAAVAMTVVTGAHSQAAAFTLPTQLKAQYSGTGKYGKLPLSGTGLIAWQTSGEAGALRYLASLDIGALFYKSTVQSQGTVNSLGIHPLRTEEKNTGRNATVITIDRKLQHASVSGRDSVLTYDATGQDLLTVIAQLGTYVQTQPKWRTVGEQKTFQVYRPAGLKLWRFQSQGMQNVLINGVSTPTIHVVQIPLEGAEPLDEQHAFWLDPARHGFPIKLRKVKSATEYVELTLKDWQEQ